MYVLITYDVNTQTPEGQKRLRRVAKCCRDYGQRVQNSVFECLVDTWQLALLKCRLEEIIDSETDSIRIYSLGSHYHSKIESLGRTTAFDMEGELIV